MKIIKTIIAGFVAATLLTASVFAQTLPDTGLIVPVETLAVQTVQTVSEITHRTVNDVEIVHIRYPGNSVYKDVTWDSSSRIVIDISKAHWGGAGDQITVNSALLSAIRLGHHDGDVMRVVLDVKNKLYYKIKADTNGIGVYVSKSLTLLNAAIEGAGEHPQEPAPATPDTGTQPGGGSTGGGGENEETPDESIQETTVILGTGVRYTNKEEQSSLSVEKAEFPTNTSEYEKYFQVKTANNGTKLTFEFAPGALKLNNRLSNVKDGVLKSVQILQDASTQKTAIIFHGQQPLTYTWVPGEDGKSFVIQLRPEVKAPENPGGTEPGGNTLPATDLKIQYSKNGNTESVAIQGEGIKEYSIQRLTNPDRIVIDMPGLTLGGSEKKVEMTGQKIKAIRYAPYTEKVARVVMEVEGLPQYAAVLNNGQLKVDVTPPAYQNISYTNAQDMIRFTLKKATLTDGSNTVKKLFKETWDAAKGLYTMTFPSQLAQIGTGKLEINDGIVRSMEITSLTATRETKISIQAQPGYNFYVATRYGSDKKAVDTAITLLKPAAKGEKLIVIDPGHGGWDPGAVYGNVQEKTLNLDIGLRLNKLLKEKNIRVYMTRTDDTYVGLYERANIANQLNAKLFVSIHNNAYLSEHNGTETLYYPQNPNSTGFNGKVLARYIQDALMKHLGLKNRGIVERPKLVVLNSTKMPAALAEVGFITNASDREKLTTESFRQKAAEALCEAIVKSMHEIP